jgi:hypothetical protein
MKSQIEIVRLYNSRAQEGFIEMLPIQPDIHLAHQTVKMSDV